MRIAFYAPMKPPTARSPSGDRTIARLLMRALEVAGCEISLASTLRTWSGEPSTERLDGFRADAARERDRLGTAWHGGDARLRPDVWFTYHNHYKAPDLLGPQIAKTLAIPYVIAEASYAPRRADGPWSEWLGEAAAGIAAASAIFSFTARDEAGIQLIATGARLMRLAPFIAEIPPPRTARDAPAGAPVRLVCVAMMREGAKAQSYRLLADALERLSHQAWTLDVVGDGAIRDALQRRLRDVCGARVRFHGRLEGAALADVLETSDVFVWPGIEEAFGMAYLEAQAHGLPVAACDTAGVGEVVVDGESGLLGATPTAAAFSEVVDRLIRAPALRRSLGERARARIEAHHSLPSAASVLGSALTGLMAGP